MVSENVAGRQTVIEYLEPRPDSWFDLLAGLRAVLTPEYIFIDAGEPKISVSSGILGGGIGRRRYFINRQVDKDYCEDRPAEEIAVFLKDSFQHYDFKEITNWTALMTSAHVSDACWVRVSHGEYRAAVVITAGVENACAAGVGVAPPCVMAPQAAGPGTINIMAFLNHALPPGALVNAVQTATEAKTQALRELNIVCVQTGTYASGTTTDALVIATADAGTCPYAGPGTPAGYILALALGIRKALVGSLNKRWKRMKGKQGDG